MPNTESSKTQSTSLGNAPFSFNEDRNTVFYHDIRVFIFGTDVTPFLQGTVSISRNDLDGVSTCSFSLSNQYRVFEITEDNLNGTFRGGVESTSGLSNSYSPEWRSSESAKKRIYDLKKTKSTNLKWSGIQSFGPGSTSTGTKTKFTKNFKDVSKATSSTAERYPFNIGSLVFHKNDPVRVFVKNPFSRDNNAWTCEFTGYLSLRPYSQDYVTGQSIINVTASDIRDLMKNMRTQTNPSAQYGAANTLVLNGGTVDQGNKNAGMMGDQRPGFKVVSHVLASKNWFESVNYLLFGTEKNKSNGVCNLSKGQTVYYDPADKNARQVLTDWNDLVVFGEPLDKTKKPNFLLYAEMLKVGLGTYFGGEYSPDNAKVHFLVPKGQAPNANLVQYTIDAQPTARIDFVSRYELLHTLCSNIDYQMYVSGMGDIIFEFPMYDFLPSYYGTYYESLYTFDKHLVSDNVNDESGTVCTAVRLQSEVIPSNYGHTAQTGTNGFESAAQLVTTVFSNVLASRVGVAEDTITRPGITDANRRVQVAMIEFMKRLANFSSFSMQATYRPFIGVNRPVFHKKKRRFGITNKVDYKYNLRADVTLDMDLNFVRKEEGDGKFRFITGGEAVPISYSTLYGKGKGFVEGQGVATSGTNGEAGRGNTPAGNVNRLGSG